MGKGKKFLSLFLAAAMAVTGINVGVPTTVQAAETEIAGMPERLAYFSFDQGTMNENGTIVSADDGMVSDDNGASTSVTASVVRGDASISDEAESKVGTGALKLSNNAYLKVTGLGLENKTAVTVSCWARLSAAANNQWIFSASQPVSGAGTRADEQYVGMMYGAGGKSVLAYRSKDAVIDSSDAASTQDGEPASRAEGTEEFDGTAWHYVTFVMGAQNGKLYLDGKLAGEISEQNSLATILGQNGELYIGANPALNQFFNGFVDEFTVYADAMTEAQVQEKYESYLDEETTKPAVVKYVVEIDGEEKALQA
ncbi:MAG: LamG domain-containing protein, partial [Lachnospiraceae bacterium]|nr:LamG domain-containing protein [Lachnospiraceae bacterium]